MLILAIHPLIHLGCGLEFHQLALIVEALAETKVSNPRMGNCLSFTEKKAISAGNPNTKSLVQIIREAGVDEKIVSVVTWDEPNKLENGPDSKVKEELAGHSKHRSVGPRQVKGEMTDLTNGAGLYITLQIHAFAKFDKAFVAAASQLPTKIVKFDFLLIHGLTTYHHLLVLLHQSWISEANKARLVAYLERLLVAVYPVVRIPKLHLNEITDYEPKHPDDGS